MYKIVVVAGGLRGKEFPLEDGTSTVGRGDECDIHIPIDGVSKEHFSITTSGDSCYIKDLGSSNGTFLNGKAVKSATVKDKDKISIPDTIFQVVHIKEKKIIIKKKVSSQKEEDDEESYISGGDPPEAPISKVLWVMKYKVMKKVYGLNEEYEWHHIIPFFIFLFVLLSVTLVIFPIMEGNKRLLITEIAERGHHYIQELARINATALSNRQIEKIDTEWITREGEGTEGVVDYRLMDMEGRIVRPSTKLNEYVSDPNFVLAWEVAKAQARNKASRSDRPFVRSIGRDTILIGKSIWAFNEQKAIQEPIGIVVIRFSPHSLKEHLQKTQYNFLEAIVKIGMAGILLFGIIYFLTVRPIEEMRFQFEDGFRGNRKVIDPKYLFKEMVGIKNSIDTSLQRIRELGNEEDDDVVEEEGDESYVRSLYEFMQGAQGAVMILDSQKNVAYINYEAEDLCGIRQSASEGMNLLDVSREQGFAATVIELCDNSANNDGKHQRGEYELSGILHQLNITALIGRDNFAKAFYITFVKDD